MYTEWKEGGTEKESEREMEEHIMSICTLLSTNVLSGTLSMCACARAPAALADALDQNPVRLKRWFA